MTNSPIRYIIDMMPNLYRYGGTKTVDTGDNPLRTEGRILILSFPYPDS